MKRRTKKLVLSCTALLAVSTMAFGLVSINDNVTVKASQSPVTLLPTASARLAKDENDASGIRFESYVSAQYFNDNANAIYGTLITPADYLSQTNVLCHDDTANGALYIYDEENDNSATGNKNAVLDIRALPEYNETENIYVFKGSVTTIRNDNLARPFAARSYVGIPDGNGGYTYEYSEVYTRSVYSVATHAVADTAKYATYTPEQQAYLDGITDKVASSVTALSVTTDKTGAKLSTDDEITVSAKVTVDTKHYDGDLDVAPMFTTMVNGKASETALTRVGANVYTLENLGNYTLTPYVGKTAKTTADSLDFNCNMLSIFTKASDITTNDSGKLVNPYITSANGWVTNNQLVHTNATVGDVTLGDVTYKNVYSYTGNGQSGSLVRLTDTFLTGDIAWKWFVFDLYVEVDSAVNASNTQIYFRYNGANFYVMGKKGTFACEGFTGYIFNIDNNGNAIDASDKIEVETYNKWVRIAIQFNDIPKNEVGWFFNLSTAKVYLKNMYLTTDVVPYCVEASGFDTNKKYTAGETINLTATAYKDGKVVENTTNEFKVEGLASLNGNVLTVGSGEIKITVTNKAMNSLYPVSRTYTIQAEMWSDLAVTGIEQNKTYAYNDIVELSATATKEGETEAQAVIASFVVKSGSAMVWQEQGKWYAKPGLGDSEISATFAGEEVTVIFKGDTNTIMLLGGETEQGYASDVMVTNYFKNSRGSSAYDYELHNGRYAVNYNTHVNEDDNFEIKTEYNYLPYMNGWLYVDVYLETDRPAIVYFTVNGNNYIYMFSGCNWESVPNDTNKDAMQQTEWQWYDMDGAPLTQPFNDNYYGRWVTLEMKLQEIEKNQNKSQLSLEKYPGHVKDFYVSSVVISKTRLIEEKQQANAQVLNILDDEQTFKNYWTPAGTDSTFTWVNDVEGRNALKIVDSGDTTTSALNMSNIYRETGYYQLVKKYNYVYIDFYYESDKEWTNCTPITNFAGIDPTYMALYANTQAYNEGRTKLEGKEVNLGLNYQWYIDSNNDGILETISTAARSYKGVWVTLEMQVPENCADNVNIQIRTYPLKIENRGDMYVSNVRLSKNSLTGITA